MDSCLTKHRSFNHIIIPLIIRHYMCNGNHLIRETPTDFQVQMFTDRFMPDHFLSKQRSFNHILIPPIIRPYMIMTEIIYLDKDHWFSETSHQF